MDEQSPDQVWCGGDLGWGGLWASECIQRVREAGWTTVKGNTDVWIAGDPQTITDPEEREHHKAMAAQHAISPDDALWLVNLPLGHSGPGSLLLVHGTPRSCFDAPMPDAPSSEFQIYEGAAKLVVFAHVHHAFSRRLKDGTIVCNTGAVGLPSDGLTASYLLVDLDGPEITFRHRRIEYDRRAVIAEARRTPDPLGSWVLKKLEV